MGQNFDASKASNQTLQYILLGLQVVAIACLCCFDITYGSKGEDAELNFHAENSYGPFQDVHVMIYIGFGFLMTFLKDYNWSSVGFNFLVGAVAIEVHTIVQAILHGSIVMSLKHLFTAEFAAGACLISMGAVLGKANHVQLVIMTIFEVVFYNLNEWLIFESGWFLNGEVFDIGGSMIIHAFGAYFGLALSRVLYSERFKNDEKETSAYNTDLFAMIGTVFLWMYWPSFNAIPAIDHFDRQTVIVNTYFALAAACITAFAVSGMDDENKRLDMVHIQNATLAGGVAMGSSASISLGVGSAVIIGTLAGAVSTIGYQYIHGIVFDKLKIHDTCGVHNLHGIPGVMGCLFSVVFGCINKPEGFSYGNQLMALVCTLLMAIVCGLFTGVICKFVVKEEEANGKDNFEDGEHWKKE